MDDKVKAAIAGFNFGLGGYLVIRTVMVMLFSKQIIDGGWMFTQALIGLVIGLVIAATAYVVMGQMQK